MMGMRLLAAAVTSVAAFTTRPQTKQNISHLNRKLRRQRPLRATANQNTTTPRRYASWQEIAGDNLVDAAAPNPFYWTEWPFRFGSIAAFYLAYPLVWQVASALPPASETEGDYFFSLTSIVFGTLTASTISDANARLSALRAAAVEECTLMLSLAKRLEVILVLDPDAPAGGDGVFRAVARRLHAHSRDLVGGGFERELARIADGRDAYGEILQILQRAQCGGVPGLRDVDFALAGCERLMEARGVRLSLENAGIPAVQYSVLRTLSLALAEAYAYLTLDPEPPTPVPRPHALGFARVGDAVVLDPSFGVHALFAVVCASLVVFNCLAIDVDRPFSGVFRLESSTVAASLKSLQSATAPYLDEPSTWPSELAAPRAGGED